MDRDFICCSVDVICDIAEVANNNKQNENNVTSLIFSFLQSSPSLSQIIIQSLDSQFNDLKYSGFTLLGDLSSIIYSSHLKSNLNSILPHYLDQIIPYDEEVINNLFWSFGELILVIDQQIITPQFLFAVSSHFISLLEKKKYRLKKKEMGESFAVCFGRISSFIPQAISEINSSSFLLYWIHSLNEVSDQNDRFQSLYSLLLVVQFNPNSIANSDCLSRLYQLISSIDHPPEPLISLSTSLFRYYSENFPSLSFR